MDLQKIIADYSKKEESDLVKTTIEKWNNINDKMMTFIKINDLEINPKNFLEILTIFLIMTDRKFDEKEKRLYEKLIDIVGFSKYDEGIFEKYVENYDDEFTNIKGLITLFSEHIEGIYDDILCYCIAIYSINGEVSNQELKFLMSLAEFESSHENQNTSNDLQSDAFSIETEDAKKLYIKDMGASLKKDDDEYIFTVGAEIINPNKNKLAENVIIKIIISDSNNKVIYTDSTRIDYIDPNSTFYFGDELRVERGTPSSYKILVDTDEFEDLSSGIMGKISVNNFSIDKRESWGDYIISGNVTNNYHKKISSVKIYLVLKNKENKIIGGNYTYVYDLFSDSTDGFDCTFDCNVSEATSVSYSVDFEIRDLF